MRFTRILKSVWAGWDRNRGSTLSASLSYYALLSLVPLITVATSLVTFLLGRASSRYMVNERVQQIFGSSVAATVAEALEKAPSQGDSVLAAVLGFLFLLWGVGGVAGELRASLNLIWDHPIDPDAGFWDFVTARLRAFLLVFSLAVVVFVLSALGILIAATGKFVSGLLPASEWVLSLVNLGVSFVLLFLVFSLVHRYVPEALVPWKAALAGGFATALFFTLGKELMTMYIGKSTVGSMFGPGRSVIVLLLWAQFSSSVLFLGAEFARACAAEMASRQRRLGIRIASSSGGEVPAAD
ncbi:hypothetical protein F183_A18890 [Bryobacterales bacterium F-183]|nr:hypothetical protein F183_A18890 [Bryobacterales bacterium F-183]